MGEFLDTLAFCPAQKQTPMQQVRVMICGCTTTTIFQATLDITLWIATTTTVHDKVVATAGLPVVLLPWECSSLSVVTGQRTANFELPPHLCACIRHSACISSGCSPLSRSAAAHHN